MLKSRFLTDIWVQNNRAAFGCIAEIPSPGVFIKTNKFINMKNKIIQFSSGFKYLKAKAANIAPAIGPVR